MKISLLCGAALLLCGFSARAESPPAAPRLEEMAITVTADHPREYIFSDKGAAHLAGEAIGANTRSYHGFYIAMHEVVDGWALRLEDGTVLSAATAYEAEVTPDRLVRRHRLASGEVVTETVEIFDRENGFKVAYDGVPGGDFAFQPRFDMRFLWKVGKPGYEVRWNNGMLLACRQDALNQAPDAAHPAWLAVAVAGADQFEPLGRHVDMVYPKGAARTAMDRTSPYLPGDIMGRIPARVPNGRVEAYFGADVTAKAAEERARRLRSEQFALRAARHDRLQKLIDDSAVVTGVPRDDKALAWARVSLDNLIMNQRGPGIYAGFYWFTTYWGRDTFITLPGASIVSGDFETAETLLRSFAEFQDLDPSSDRQGRVPNFVTVDQVQYASIDGTWWFVRALDELWRQAGNDKFAAEMAPIVYRAVDGALAHAVDDQGFLTHGDGETWMDGGGEANPYSPRGNRGVEVQALWHRGLLTAARLAERFPEVPGARSDYAMLANRLESRFHASFWSAGRLIDHLNIDGSQDTQIRPNTMLAVLSSPTLFNAEQRTAITELAGRELVMPWGVLSLNASDPNFHPKHLNLSEYYYDEAYHNGDVWLWLSGSYVSALNSPYKGFGQTRMLLEEVLEEGAVGTIQEIRDGAEADSNDEFGGATSQAWSLAELLRNVVQDYAGLKVDLTASPPLIEVKPSVPGEWPQLAVRTKIGDREVLLVPGTGDGSGPGMWFKGGVPKEWVFRWQWARAEPKTGVLEVDTEAPAGWNRRVVWQ
ncbi:MAG: amylo-alpha-1,6-glucosidase [Candidatus Krumholzibacteria bacterium]|nr:amylo-alpha-1,6-glucosidase [Candidatus Krumholzibacteria bacterium]